MSSTFSYKARSVADVNLLQQVLSQGEKLRDSIVKTILKQDPLYSPTPPTTSTSLVAYGGGGCFSTNPTDFEKGPDVYLNLSEKHKILAYMNGDPMSVEEEKQVLDSCRSIASSELCDLTARSFATTQNNCKCDTCRAYCKMKNSKPVPMPFAMKSISRVSFCDANAKICDYEHDRLLKYVNSFKVALHSFILSDQGRVKILQSQCDNSKNKTRMANSVKSIGSLNITYFIEYEVPKSIAKFRIQSKVDSGLHGSNSVKCCSKKCINDVIYFKQVSLHDIDHLKDLNEIELKFKVSCRIFRQTRSIVLGFGSFNFGDFNRSANLSTLQEVVVYLSEDSPVISGAINLQLQLGCDRLYFGKDFIESLHHNKENREVGISELNAKLVQDLDDTFTVPSPKRKQKVLQKLNEKLVRRLSIEPSKNGDEDLVLIKTAEVQVNLEGTQAKFHSEEHINHQTISNSEILFGFIFISEAEYTASYRSTYFSCQPFCQHDYVYSPVIRTTHRRPCFNFHQLIPFVYDDDFLFRLRDNYMIIEFFTQTASDNVQIDEVIGITRIPLHQYYLAFRNPLIVKYLERNRLPVIGTDWFEPIQDPSSGECVGNVQILVALGTEVQVHNLQQERGFMDDIVRKAKCIIESSRLTKEQEPKIRRTTFKPVRNVISITSQTDTPVKLTSDKGTAVTPPLNKLREKPFGMEDKVDNRLETIQNYLQQLVSMKTQPVCDNQQNNVNNTNATGPSKTSNLLEALETAIGEQEIKELREKGTFKVSILIESALRLPTRKKSRVKKVKGKVIREELSPSTYVSFELKEGVVKTTHVVQKNTCPTWNVKFDVALPVEFLTNCNRPMIFKVWKKSNNGSTIPNMQIDTIIGVATLDLAVLLVGLPTIVGWFNIMDFSNKCNGQIKITVTPMENLTKFNTKPLLKIPSTTATTTTPITEPEPEETSPGETLSRALKRKFIELDEISQRLKSRLHSVTDDPDGDTSTDDIADEFEKDINTLCVEEDYDQLDFAREAQDLNMQRVSCSLHQWQRDNDTDTGCSSKEEELDEYALHMVTRKDNAARMSKFVPSEDSTSSTSEASSSFTQLGQHLVQGKDRIDDLLQRLTLLSQPHKSTTSSSNESEESTTSVNKNDEEGKTSSTTLTSNDIIEHDILEELGISNEGAFDVSKLMEGTLMNFNGNLNGLLRERHEPDGDGGERGEPSDDAAATD